MAKLISFNRAAISIMLAGAMVVSCVNPDYDLSKGVDMDMTLLPNTTIPLGNIASVSVSDLFGGESSGLTVSEDGDLSITFGGGESRTSFEMPQINMGGEDGFSSGNTTVHFKTGIDVPEIPDLSSDKEIHFSEVADQENQSHDGLLDTYMEIEIDKELPKEIRDIKVVNMSHAMLTYVFMVSDGGLLHLKEGFTMEFPHYMVLEMAEQTDRYSLKDGYIVVFNEDTFITHEKPLTLPFRFRSVYGHEYDDQGNLVRDLLSMEPVLDDQGNKKATHIFHKDRLDIKGDVYLKYRDYADAQIPVPSGLDILMFVEMTDLEMTSAELMLDVDFPVEPQQIELGGSLGGIFDNEDNVLDLYNPSIILSVDNNSPMALNINADITSHVGSKEKTVHIGDEVSDPIYIHPDSNEEFCLSEHGNEKGNNAEEVVVTGLSDMIKDMPDYLEIHNVEIAKEASFVMVDAGSRFDMVIAYDFMTPLAFGEDLSIDFSYDMELGSDASAGMTSLILSMNMENTIPLELNITGTALDAEGNEIEDADVALEVEIAGGTVDSPAVTPVQVVISEASKPVSKLRLQIEATSSEDLEGEVLNVEQGLNLKDMVITLPDGISLDLTSNIEK